MKIFLVLSSVPNEQGEAIEVVSYEVVRLMSEAGHKLVVQVLIREEFSDLMAARGDCARLHFSHLPNVTLLPIIYLGDIHGPLSKLRRLVAFAGAIVRSIPPINRIINPYFFPALVAQDLVAKRVAESSPDILLSIWSWEALAATYAIPNVPKFVYYGNPNHKPPEAQLRFPELFEIPTKGFVNLIKITLFKLFNRARELQHLKMMAACEVTANNSLVDAQYYRDMGHHKSIYLQNMWPEDPRGPVFGGCPDPKGPISIVGSVGNLGATGNTFGLNYLGRKLAPVLEQRLGDKLLEINIYGGGQARRPVCEAINRESIHLQGWVDDLVDELHRSHVFLVLTNVDGFIVGNTRILLAWSLGSCVVAHRNSALSMPEIEHMKNALLGDTPEELAELIIQASEDDDLRERIGRGGYETFRQDYLSENVIPRMLTAMKDALDETKNIGRG